MERVPIPLLMLLFASCAYAHMSIWVPSMWGSEPNNINANWAVQPLQDLNFVDWWMHGPKSVNDPPPADKVTHLPAGGVLDFEITGNKAFTSMGRGLWVAPGKSPRDIPDPWSNDMNGGSSNIHAPTHADVAGCALAIAYKSKISDVQPTDFAIFSVVHDCIARQLQAFDIPALPACPNGQCICSWFWIHKSIGGTDQNYMTPFQCNVTNPSNRPLGKSSVPVRCDGQPPCYLYPNWGNKTTVCPKGPLQPFYWANNEGNNMHMPVNWQCAPTYSTPYGFADGAQKNIYASAIEEPHGSVGDTLHSHSETNSLMSHGAEDGTILVSPSIMSSLTVSKTGNVELTEIKSGKIIWSTNTADVEGVAPYNLQLEKDGNLILTDSESNMFWSSNSANRGCAPYKLKLRDINSLTVVDCNSSPVWTAV